MMAGRDGFGLSLADRPATFPCSAARRSTAQVHDGGVYIDGTFGAGGYSPRILRPPTAASSRIDRDPSAIAAGAELVDSRAAG